MSGSNSPTEREALAQLREFQQKLEEKLEALESKQRTITEENKQLEDLLATLIELKESGVPEDELLEQSGWSVEEIEQMITPRDMKRINELDEIDRGTTAISEYLEWVHTKLLALEVEETTPDEIVKEVEEKRNELEERL